MLFIATTLVLLLKYAESDEGDTFAGFTDLAAMPSPRSDMTANVHGTGDFARVYLMGGCAQDQVCEDANDHFSCYCTSLTADVAYYLPHEDRYVTDLPPAPLERYRHAAAIVDNVLYVFGGRTASDEVIREIHALDLIDHVWSTKCTADSSTAASDHTAFTENGRIFLAGGYLEDYTSLDALYEWDPEDCSFTSLSSMSAPRGDVASLTLPLDYADDVFLHFVVGGFGDDICNGLTTVESYDVTTDSWRSHDPLLLGRADMALGHLGGRLFAIAGETVSESCGEGEGSRSIPVEDVERFVADNARAIASTYHGSWVVEEGLPGRRFRFVGASVNDDILLFGGQGAWVDNILGDGRGGFPVLAETIRYTPRTVREANDDLEGGEVAGVVIAVIAFVAVFGCLAIAFFTRRRYYGYRAQTNPDDVVKETADIDDEASA